MKKPCGKIVGGAMLVLFFLPVFFSCSMKAEQKSFTASLDQIDALISQKQYKDAVSELEKAEKHAYSSWSHIGIFKRYNQLGKTEHAEKVLAHALKKNPGSMELSAVYSNFLLRGGRIQEALEAGSCLRGTKYGSIYSEAVFADTAEKAERYGVNAVFDDDVYFQVYYDAYTGSNNSAWLRNCALLNLKKGNFEKAAELRPAEVYESDDAFFWALVMYDAGRYGDAAAFADAAEELYASSSGRIKNKLSLLEIASIKSDSFVSLADMQSAEDSRRSLLASFAEPDGSWNTAAVSAADEKNLPVMFVNSALWAKNNGSSEDCLRLLSYAVGRWPDYVPGLAAYADFAYESSMQRKEDSEQLALRDAGLATLEMERYDSRVKIPLSDALYRIDESIKRTGDPLLRIIRLDLKYKTDLQLSDAEKCADIWRLLEQSAESTDVYPPLLLHYAVHFFLKTKRAEDAWQIYYKYILSKYGIPADSDFWKNLTAKVHSLKLQEAEFAAYFAASSKRADDALRLYEYCVFENGGSVESGALSPEVSDMACVNLAMIYNSLGKRKQALELYGKAAGRAADVRMKSLVMYRLALIYYAAGDFSNARRSAEYSVTLYPKNADSRLLINKIRNANK